LLVPKKARTFGPPSDCEVLVSSAAAAAAVIPFDALIEHWQGHRRLTRRMIERYPDEQLWTFAIGGMRPFGQLALEMLSMAEPTARGIATGEWETTFERTAMPKAEVLRRWDESTQRITEYWASITPERLSEHMVAFGQFPGRAYDLLLYVIDNEIHHRGQGYVYLRALGVEPPPFWER